MTVLESLLFPFENLIVATESKDIKKLILTYVTLRLMHEVRRKEQQNVAVDNASLVAYHYKSANRGGSSHASGEFLLYCTCGKLKHFTQNW